MKFRTILILFTALYFVKLNATELNQNKKYILSTKTLKNGIKKVEIDLNLDKKVDRIENYKNGKLISVEIDSNFSGKTDQWITYLQFSSPKTPIQISKISSKDNAKVDRIKKFYRDPENDLFITTTEVDENLTGNFNKKWTIASKLVEKKEEISCDSNLDYLEIIKLTDELKSVNQTLSSEFLQTERGYKIHQSCLDNWGSDSFPKILETAMNKGFQCLEKLAKNNSTDNSNFPFSASNNLNSLNNILQNSGVSIICNEENYNWTDVAGHASVSPGQIIKNSNIEHPFISLNNKHPKIFSKPTLEESSVLAQTLFHEQLHNLGIRHGEDIELPYACETCCLSEDQGDKTKDACKVCTGSYTSSTDKNYLADIIAWGKSSDQSKRSAKAILKFQKEFPNDRFGLFAYAAAIGDINSPVGIEMGKILKEKFSPLSFIEEEFIKSSERRSNNSNFKKTEGYSKMLAEVHIALYYEQDTKKALDLIENASKEFKTIMAMSNLALENDRHIYSNLKTQVYDLLFDIWIQGYPDDKKSENYRAQNILITSGLLKI